MEYHALSLIFTQRFSVGHFWSPYHTTNEGIFGKLFINAENPISYKYSAPISFKIPHFHTISSISVYTYNYTKTTALGTKGASEILRLFFLFDKRLKTKDK